jgi:nitrate/TMAO reductase-like tetraheme cytochrome c subunit
MKTVFSITLTLLASAFLASPTPARSQAALDCLSCHGDAGMQDAAGHNISVDAHKFGDSIHGSLKCNDCHTGIKEYPHPDKVAPVE